MTAAVIDSSALIDALSDSEGDGTRQELMGLELHAPHLIGVEVMSWLRRLSLRGKVDAALEHRLRGQYAALPLQRYPHEPFLDRAWELRDIITAYDAQYVVLAEVLHLPLVTCDRRLAAAAAPFCAVIVPE